MASALHIYANLLWRDNRVEARIKKVAALRLLQEQHYRLHLDELSKSLVSGHGSAISRELLAPDHLADVVSADSCFVYNEGTGNVLLDAASLMAAGKECLKLQIDKVWDTSSPLSWARNQLAWYIVSRQHIDMRPTDLFLAPVDDAESFLAAAWTARMDLRDHSEHPYRSLRELLGGESRFEVTADQNGIRLNFHRLLQQQDSFPVALASQHLKQLLQSQQQFGSGSYLGNGHESKAIESSAAVTDWGQSGSDDGNGGGGGYGSSEATMQHVKLSPQRPMTRGGPEASNGPFDYNGAGAGVDESYEDADEYIDGGDDYDENDGEVRAHETRNPGAAAAYGGGAAAGYGGAGGVGGSAAAAAPLAYSGSAAGAAAPTRPAWPLRPDLLPQYVRAVWGSSGSSFDQLMAVVALALAEAGRGPASGSNHWQAPPPSGPSSDTHRFCMLLPLLVAHVREVAPHLLPTPASGSHGSTAVGHAGILMQRLRERPSRGCFRVLLPGSTTSPADGGASRNSNGASGEDDGEEALAILDLEVLRERVIEALTSAAAAVFSGSRPVDEIRRTAAVHLATRTRPFAGRVHCVRLSTLARALAEQLPPDVFDPTRLSGFERLVGSESSSNVMHVFRKLLPSSPGVLSHGLGEELGTFVTLNLGKLLAAAGIREPEGLALMRGGRGEGRGGDGVSGAAWGGRAAVDAAPSAAAAAASRAAAFAAASATAHSSRDVPPPPPPPPPAQAHSSNNLSPPPSDAALRRAVETLFPVPDGGRGGGGEYAIVAAAAKRTAALSLVKALHTQQGGFLPMSRLTDIVESVMAGAPDLEQLLALEPDFFEIKEAWYGGPRSVRLRSSAVMARVGGLTNAPAGATSGAVANGSGNHGTQAVAGGSESLPRRPNTLNCPYYMRHGTCGFGVTCKYNHPPLAPRPSGESSPAPAASGSVGSAAPPGLPPQRTASFRHQLQPPQSPQPLQSAPATASAQTTSDGSSAAGAGGGTAASRMPPPTLEVKIVTTACNPVHIDMLQHCYAAPQVALACKVRHAWYTHLANSSGVEVDPVCLVQLYAPAVAAPGSSSRSLGFGGDGPAGSGSSATAGGGASAPRWPATVYLIDPAAGEDKNGLLLPSLSALLEDPAVAKVVYCGSEVVPYMPRISPLYDISILHALLARAPHAVLGPGAGATELVVPPLGTLLQQHWVVSPAGAAAAAAAPTHSPTWAVRPLADELRQQAVLEVVHLASLWTSLMARLAKLPLQLSQVAADRLHLDHSERSAAAASATAVGASAVASTGPPLMHPAARAPTVAVPAGVAVLVPAVPVAPPGPAAGQQRAVVSMHRIGHW